VFALGEDEDEDEVPAPQPRTLVSGNDHSKPQRPTLPMRQYSPASRTSTASEGTLHDTPSPSSSNGSFSHKPHGSRTGAYDQPAEAEEPVWQPRSDRDRMTVGRFLEICLTWVRRTQVVIAYVVLLTGIAIYTVRSEGLVQRYTADLRRACAVAVTSTVVLRTTSRAASSSGEPA
jgi:hypothetical protein